MKLLNPINYISIILFFLSFFICGNCPAEYNLATQQEENIFISTPTEVKLGRSLSQRIEKEYKLCADEKMQERVDRVGQQLAAGCDRKDITFCFKVLEEEKVNAVALPGGYVYINKGAVEKAESDDEIAACLAHEIGHIAAQHSMKRLQASLGYNLLSLLALAATKDVSFKHGTDIAFAQIMLGYSREDELLADKLSVKYLQKCGYNPEAIVSFLKKIQQIEKEAPLEPLIPNYVRTHPYLPERIANVKKEIRGKFEFNDYINIDTSKSKP